MNITENNWQMIFINFVLIGIILLMLFRVLRFSLPWLLRNPKKLGFLKRQLPVIEIVFWFLYLSWFVFRFAQKLEVYALVVAAILFILLFWFSKFYLREIIAGIIFKTTGRYKKGDTLQTGDYSGKILRFRSDVVELESSDGRLIFLPYSQLTGGAVNIKSEGAEKASGYSFEMITDPDMDPAAFEQALQSHALSLPWISISKPIQVSLQKTGAEGMAYKVTVYLLDRTFSTRAEKAIREQFEISGTKNN
ncbi:MAG: mechanosensitive ion channel family protein [Bacteroidetes bacterium]|nr:mechanosensitive ion channel family protein [Bacteroidota bacterium]